MLKYGILILMTTLVVLLGRQQAEAGFIDNLFSGEHFEKIYDKISDHLEWKKPNETDRAADMRVATNWLVSRISKTIFPFEKEALIKVLNQLLGLDRLKDDTDCNMNSYEILKANNLSTRGQSMDFDKGRQPESRIVKVVRYYFRLHAKSCKEHYSSLLESEADIDKDEIEKVKAIRDGFVAALISLIARFKSFSDFSGLIWEPPVEGKMRWNDLTDKDSKKDALDWIIHHLNPSLELIENPNSLLEYLSRSDEDSLSLIRNKSGGLDIERIKLLYMKHMVNPCRNYVNHRADVHFMLEIDNKLIDLYRDNFDLYKSSLNYRLCRNLVEDDVQDSFFGRLIYELSV